MSTPAALPTPSQMIAHLDRFVRGQARAKQDLSVAVYNHYLSQAVREREGTDLGRHHVLLIGPTGVGKTHLVRTLADYLGVPVGFASAAGLVEAGYKGNSVETIIKSLLDRAGGDPRKAERGIVFLDEVDKIRRGDAGGTRDISGEGVQNALLTLLDGRLSSGFEGGNHATVDTGRMLFVATGAFVGLDAIVNRRIGAGRGRIGFTLRPAEAHNPSTDQPVYRALCQAQTSDLVDFGMIPEFIGRFATLTVLHELTAKDLRGIMSEQTERSPLALQQRLAALHGIRLEFTDDALDALSAEAAALGTGARGLGRLIGRAVDPVDYRWAELADEGVTRVVITAECALGRGEPTLEKGPASLERLDAALRQESMAGLPPRPSAMLPSQSAEATGSSDTTHMTPPGPRDVSGWTPEQIWNAVEATKVKHLGWKETDGSARKWWEAFEKENQHRPALVHRLAEELRIRGATITEFFLAYVYSNTDNIQANLHYLDYRRAKEHWEKRPGSGGTEGA